MEPEVMPTTLEYVDSKTNEEKSIDIKLLFLTPRIRSEIVKFDMILQKESDNLKKEYNELSLVKKNQERQQAILKYRAGLIEKESLKKDEDEIDYSEIDKKVATFILAQKDDVSDQELADTEKYTEKTWDFNYTTGIQFFQMIVNRFQLQEEEKKLILSKPGSPFWQNVDIKKVTEFNQFFRRHFKV